VTGDWLALGTVGLLAAAGATRRGSRSRFDSPLGERCDPYEHSHSWISPQGEIHLLGGADHVQWAADYLIEHGHLTQYPSLDVWKPKILEKAGSISSALMRLGFVRVSNPWHLAVWKGEVPDAAWRAAAELLVRCIVREGSLDDDEEVRVDDASNASRPFPGSPFTVERFIRKFGGRELEEAMFARLLENLP